MTPLNTKLRATIFSSVDNPRGELVQITASEFEEMIIREMAEGPNKEAAKAKLPLIKFAVFEDNYRSDKNLIECSAIEGDYDGEKLSMADAARLLKKAGLAALLYTSPRHTASKPRWRVIAFLKSSCPPDVRARYVARLQGVLRGVLAVESFTKSQPFYFGGVNGVHAEVVTIPGEFIDVLDDLDEGAIGKAETVQADTKPKDGVDRSAVLLSIAKDVVRLGGTMKDFEEAWPKNEFARGHVAKHDTEAGKQRAVDRAWNRAVAETTVLIKDHDQSQPASTSKVTLYPYANPDAADIPRREFLYGPAYIRGFVSALIAPGGAAKTSMTVTEAVSMAAARDLLRIDKDGRPAELGAPLNVCLWNLEDDIDEMERRIKAVQIYFAAALHGTDISKHLFVNAASEALKIGRTISGEAILDETLIRALTKALRESKVDVLIVDPFISSHGVPESDNDAIDLVVKAWARIAREADCSVTLVHHVRKGPTGGDREIGVEDARGASALINACRFGRVINRMSKEGAPKLGVPPDLAWAYLRVDPGKANLAPPGDAEWRRLRSVELRNSSSFEADDGDRIGVIEAWTPPDLSKTTFDERERVMDALGAQPWRESSQAGEWVGKPIASALGLSLDLKTDRAKVNAMIKTGIAAGWLVKEKGLDEKRKPRPMLRARRRRRTREEILS